MSLQAPSGKLERLSCQIVVRQLRQLSSLGKAFAGIVDLLRSLQCGERGGSRCS